MSLLSFVSCATLALTCSATHLTKQNDSFPDTPANHWAYQAMADLHSVGLLVGYPESLGRRVRPKSRYESALSAHFSDVTLMNKVRELRSVNEAIAQHSGTGPTELKSISDKVRSLNADVRMLRRILPTIQSDMLQLNKEFMPELRSLGVNIDEMNSQILRDCRAIADLRIAKIGEANTQFADVPEGHWAAKSVQSLRAAGILHGYEGTHFLTGTRL
jgi:hypothetical protein